MGANIAVVCRGGGKLKLANAEGITAKALVPSDDAVGRDAVGPDDKNDLTDIARRRTLSSAIAGSNIAASCTVS